MLQLIMKRFVLLFPLLLAASLTFGQGISYPPPGAAALNWGGSTTNVTISSIHIENAGSGDVDLFTVPAGSRALVMATIYNSAGTTTTYFTEINKSSTYFRTGTNATILTNVTANVVVGQGLVGEAGDKFTLNTSQAGLNIFGAAFVFPSTEKLRSYFISTVASGNNTIGTVPAGKTWLLVSGNTQMLGVSAASFIAILNASGGALNYKANIVLSAGSPGTANQITPNVTALANNTLSFLSNPFNISLAAGSFVNLNSSGNGQQNAWITVIEQ